MISMIKNRVISGAIFVAIFISIAVSNRCCGQNCIDVQEVVHAGDTLNIECDKMVLMDVETFADYWHSKKQLEELRNEVPEWTTIIDSIHGEHEKNRVELDSIIDLKSEQIAFYEENQEELMKNLYYCDKSNRKWFRRSKKYGRISKVSIGINAVLLLILL